MNQEKLRVHFGNSKVELFDELIEKKQSKINELKTAVNSELSLRLDYEHKFNEKLLSDTLTDDVKESTGESRPTKDMKEAYIIEQLKTEYNDLQIAIENSKLIRKDLELLDNQISLEKYVLQLELKK